MSYGHLFAGMSLGLKPKRLSIMPFGVTVTFEDYQSIKRINMKKAIIAVSGPLTNLFIAVITIVTGYRFLNIGLEKLIYSNLLICIFNLIPIYPLDGGRIVKSILNIKMGLRKSDKTANIISNISIIILTIIASILILFIHNVGIIVILTYLWYLIILENKRYRLKTRIYKRIEHMCKNKSK